MLENHSRALKTRILA